MFLFASSKFCTINMKKSHLFVYVISICLSRLLWEFAFICSKILWKNTRATRKSPIFFLKISYFYNISSMNNLHVECFIVIFSQKYGSLCRLWHGVFSYIAFNARPMTEIYDDSIFCLVWFFAEKSISIWDNVIGFIRSNVTWKNHCHRLDIR